MPHATEPADNPHVITSDGYMIEADFMHGEHCYHITLEPMGPDDFPDGFYGLSAEEALRLANSITRFVNKHKDTTTH